MNMTHAVPLAVLAVSSASFAGGLGLEPVEAFAIHAPATSALGTEITLTENGDQLFAGRSRGSLVMPPDIVLIGPHQAYVAKYAADGTPVFAKILGGAVPSGEYNYVEGIATMPDGGGAMVGYFKGSIQLGPHSLVSGPDDKMWVTRLSETGDFLWAMQSMSPAGYTSQSRAFSVVTDAAGNIYFTGLFTTDFLLGPSFSLLNADEFDAFLVKVSPDGDVLWGVRIGGAGNQIPRGITLNESGDVFVSGEFTVEAEFTPSVVEPATGSEGVFLAKYSGADGAFEWARFGQQPGTRNITSSDVETDADGNVYISGAVAGYPYTDVTLHFDAHSVVSRGSYLVKYTPDGEVTWARSACERCELTGMDVNDDGIIVFSGIDHGVVGSDSGPTVDFGPLPGGSVVARFNTLGELRRAVRFHAAISIDVAINNSGLITATGYLADPEDFGDTTLVNVTVDDSSPSAWVSLFQPGVDGDANADGIVNFADINVLLATLGFTSGGPDMNFDGIVDFAEFNLVLSNFGMQAP